MKKIPYLVIALIGSLTGLAQATLTLQPNSTTGFDSQIASNAASQNYGSAIDDMAYTWSFGGTTGIGRGLIKFDLSSIPTTATVTSASLYFYSDINSTSGSSGQPTYGSDSFLVRKITSSWTESGVTWTNQPGTSIVNQVSVPKSTSTTQNYVINIINLAQGFVNNPSTNYGVMFSMANEVTPYSSVIFASSNHSNAALHPAIRVCYTIANSIKTIHTNENNFSFYPNPNNGVFTIETSNTAKQTVQMHDVTGKLVLSQVINGNTNIDAGSLNEGVYNLVIISKDRMINKKVVIVR